MDYALLINCGYAGYDGGCVAREGEYFYIFILYFFLRVGVHIFLGEGGYVHYYLEYIKTNKSCLISDIDCLRLIYPASIPSPPHGRLCIENPYSLTTHARR